MDEPEDVRQLDLAALADQTGLGAAQMHVERLDGGKGALGWSWDDGRWVYPASMIKVPLAVAAAQAIADGRLRWDTPVTVDPRNATVNDAPSPMLPGYATSVEELVTFMLQRSDNVATNQLYDVLGRDRATADVHALGFRDTFFRRKLSGSLPLIDDPEASGRNSFPAAEAARLFVAIAEDRIPEAAVAAPNPGHVVVGRQAFAGPGTGRRVRPQDRRHRRGRARRRDPHAGRRIALGADRLYGAAELR